MKKIAHILLLLFTVLLLFSCKKEELVHADGEKVVKLEIKGYVMVDTLEFVNNGNVIGTAIDNDFRINASLFKANDQIQIRKKADSKEVGKIIIPETPFNQVRKIFYDGHTLSDNIQLTPVKDSTNMGFRLRFYTPFKDFYGGPVDIAFFDLFIDFNTFEFIYTPLDIVAKNVTNSFGEFIELPPPATDHSYVFKVYKAGTTELPYKSMDNVVLTDPQNNYSFQLEFTPGLSKLLSVSPFMTDDGKIADGYDVIDYSEPFH